MDTIHLLKANEYIDTYAHIYIYIHDVFHITVVLDHCVTKEVVMEMFDYRGNCTSLHQHSRMLDCTCTYSMFISEIQ